MIHNILEIRKEFQYLFESSLDYLIIYDFEGHIYDVNEIIIKNLGYSKEEILNMSILDFVVEEEKEQAFNALKEIKVKRKFTKYTTYKIQKKNGSIIFLEFSGIIFKLQDEQEDIILGIGHDITLLKQTETTLKESEEKYRSLIEGLNQIGIGIDIVSDDYRILSQNETLIKRFGNGIGQLCFERYLGLTNPCDTCPMLDAIKNNRIKSIELKANDGKIYEIIAAPLPNSDGTINKAAEVVLDITDRVISRQNLKESEEKYRVLFEGSNDAIFLMNKYRFAECNAKTIEIFGCNSEDDIIGLNPWDFSPPNQPDGRNSKQKAIEYIEFALDGKPQKFYWKHNKKDNSLFDAEVSLNRITINNKYYLQALVRDVSERFEAEKKLKESEEKFRTITEQSYMGIMIIKDWEIKYSNQKFADIIGYTTKEIINWTLDDFFKIVHPEDINDLYKIAKKKHKQEIEMITNYQFRIIKKTGEIIWLEVDSKTIIYEKGLSDLTTIIDITEKKEAEKLIIEENEKLLELHEMRKDIITRVSHELKTPLTSIYGASEILMGKLKEEMNEKVLYFMDIFHRGAKRLKELINDLLDASILDAKKFELKLEKEDIIEIIRDCIKEMEYMAEVRELKLKAELPENLFLEVDKIRIRQAISNIISNAIKNTPNGGEIIITLNDFDMKVDISIKDTGVGITEKEKTKLFEKFGKIERYGMNLDVDIEGSGLGLFISKEIVEFHGGKILVESEGRNKGAIFTIRLFKNK